MPRNAAGVYSLPNPPRVPNTIIYALDENQTRDDIANALTESLDRYGRGTMVAPLRFVDGSEAAPSVSFVNETDSGLYRLSSNDIRMSVDGSDILSMTTAGMSMMAGTTLSTDTLGVNLQLNAEDVNVAGDLDLVGNMAIGGDIEILGDLSVGSSALGTGEVGLHSSAAPLSGYVEFIDAAGTPLAYMGAGLDSSKLPVVCYSGGADGFGFQAGLVSISNGNDAATYGTALLSLNILTQAYNGIAVNNVNGDGVTTLVSLMNTHAGVTCGSIQFNATTTSYNTSSDLNLKDNIEDLDNSVVSQVIDALSPVIFDWKQGGKGIGFIAQDVHTVVPEAVTPPSDKIDTWQMDFSKLMPYVIAELKSLRKRVEFLGG